MYKKLEKCPLCSSGHFNNYLICRDHSISKESFAIVECEVCKFKFTNPRPETNKIIKYYESDSYVPIANRANTLINLIYQLVRKFTLKSKIRLINELSTKGNILDVGCGTGHFLQVCVKDGWKVQGVEQSMVARNYAQELLGITIYEQLSDIESLNQKYEIISLWHVLEHMEDLDQTMVGLKNHLSKNGTIVTAVPNCHSFDAKYYKSFWAGFDVPRHFYHFTQKTMEELVKRHQMKIRQIIPMKWDAYYISWLSENYRRSENQKLPDILKYLKFPIMGWRSNRWASKNNNDYSSLVYIIK
ncbi:MAG: class I SAM-dependent methyltransferase [Bacteroidetes bacterium]|nr:class I SAM-dependent methyltransferase [Bacteroidota bacterium]